MNTRTPLSLMDFVKAAKTRISEVSPRALQDSLEGAEDLLVVDVREPAEYEQAHIRNALLVPRGILEAAADPSYPKQVPELSSARERHLVLYCATGGRSAMAADTLQQMGFKHVTSLDGGFVRWVEEGMPVVAGASYV